MYNLNQAAREHLDEITDLPFLLKFPLGPNLGAEQGIYQICQELNLSGEARVWPGGGGGEWIILVGAG